MDSNIIPHRCLLGIIRLSLLFFLVLLSGFKDQGSSNCSRPQAIFFPADAKRKNLLISCKLIELVNNFINYCILYFDLSAQKCSAVCLVCKFNF